MEYIFIDRYRQLFIDHIEEALDYVHNIKDEDLKVKVRFQKFNFSL